MCTLNDGESRFEVCQLVEGLPQSGLVFIRENDHHRLPTTLAEFHLGENLPEKRNLGSQLQPATGGGDLSSGVDLHVVKLLHCGEIRSFCLKT